ncbi:hypothetical protein B0T16DRAFT_392038 [Cercophora newfieldiana]|uniref:Uncharacterized protein n=1 Tax=Cercophora newfieldiana TaxID=92897 RepID=A0AA39Y2W1_9PEZI|nr:hypothetical protein B0T16DRAFT_392038 [Cercophora newfieldiana]
MAAATEPSAQFERDLRGSKQEWKRGKDSSEKWARGVWPAPGIRLDMVTGLPVNGTESHQAKVRPRSRFCDNGHHTKRTPNFVKMRNGYDAPASRVKAKLHAARECDDPSSLSISELPPLTPRIVRRMSTTDNALYSYDRTDTPGKPLTLDIFIKAPTARDTEKFVEKEYEILDANGQALKGRKARHNLRHAATDPDGEEITEVDGFELL